MSRLAQLPAGLSIYQLLVDHIDSHQALTGRRLGFQEAAISLDHWRGEPWHSTRGSALRLLGPVSKAGPAPGRNPRPSNHRTFTAGASR